MPLVVVDASATCYETESSLCVSVYMWHSSHDSQLHDLMSSFVEMHVRHIVCKYVDAENPVFLALSVNHVYSTNTCILHA